MPISLGSRVRLDTQRSEFSQADAQTLEPPIQPSTRTQSIRDLEWALTSPSLIAPSIPARGIASSINSTGLDPLQEKLDDFLQGESPRRDQYRVGRYFERLLLFYLQHIRQVEVVASAQQIQEEGRTIGELDFVFRDESGLQHWEVAVKFYLHFPGEHISGSHLIGPDPRDNFETKITRLFEHQLPISEKVFPDIAERHAFVKGRVFCHPSFTPPDTLPAELSPAHLRGVWLYHGELDWLSRLPKSSSPTLAKIVQKPFWLSPDVVADAKVGLSAEGLLPIDQMQELLQQHFRESSTPRLVSLLSRQAQEWREFERVFVVSESWPHEAA